MTDEPEDDEAEPAIAWSEAQPPYYSDTTAQRIQAFEHLVRATLLLKDEGIKEDCRTMLGAIVRSIADPGSKLSRLK